MRRLQLIIVILLVPALMWGQKRYQASNASEHGTAGKRGFSYRDVESQVDALFGLHASYYTGNHHLIGFSAEGGWSTMLTSMPNVSYKPGGGSGGLHFVYEFQHTGFLLQTGVGLTYQNVTNALGDSTITVQAKKDMRFGDPWNLDLYISNQRFDESQQVYAQVPLYMGRYFFGKQTIWYFLAGVKVNYKLWGNTKQTTHSTSIIKYEQVDESFSYKDTIINRIGDDLKLKFDLLAHLEVGYEYSLFQNSRSYKTKRRDRIDCRIRVSAFADFSVLDICPNTGNEQNQLYKTNIITSYEFHPEGQLAINYSDSNYQMSHVFSTTTSPQNAWLRNVFVGVRATVLFGFQNKERCILCSPWKR